MRPLAILPLLLVALLALFAGCGGVDGGLAGPGQLGVTPGGAQDIDYVRTLIDEGQVPQPDNFVVEGIYSEYDLPVEGEATEDPVAIRQAHGWAGDPVLPGGGLYVQLGFSTGIDAESFARPALDLAIVLDRSGSMLGAKMTRAKQAVSNILSQLEARDRVCIVLFNQNAEVLLEPRAGDQVDEAVYMELNQLVAGGSTNMAAGMEQGFSFLRDETEEGDERSNRLILLTDANANTGDYSVEGFQRLVAQGVEGNIGLSAIAIGIDLHHELIETITTSRGGNYYFLDSIEEANRLFNERFAYMVTPIAHDFRVELASGQGMELAACYGFPGAEGNQAVMEVATLFVSDKRGAVMFAFDYSSEGSVLLPSGAPIANMTLEYTDLAGQQYRSELPALYSGPDITEPSMEYYSQTGVELATVLTREMVTLKQVCRLWHLGEEGEMEEARGLLSVLRSYLLERDDALAETDLTREIEMVETLQGNMGGGEL